MSKLKAGWLLSASQEGEGQGTWPDPWTGKTEAAPGIPPVLPVGFGGAPGGPHLGEVGSSR